MLHGSNFIKYTRQHNSVMGFGSFSATHKYIPGNGPYCYKVQEQFIDTFVTYYE